MVRISAGFLPEMTISTSFWSPTSTFSPSTKMTCPSTMAETPLRMTERESGGVSGLASRERGKANIPWGVG